jgi:hypothetical protein
LGRTAARRIGEQLRLHYHEWTCVLQGFVQGTTLLTGLAPAVACQMCMARPDHATWCAPKVGAVPSTCCAKNQLYTRRVGMLGSHAQAGGCSRRHARWSVATPGEDLASRFTFAPEAKQQRLHCISELILGFLRQLYHSPEQIPQLPGRESQLHDRLVILLDASFLHGYQPRCAQSSS